MFQDSPIPAGVASEDVWPQNYDGDPTGKTFPVNYFLKRSINTLPAQICYNIGIDTIFKFTTEKFHLDLDPIHDRTYSALAVGGTFEGPTLLNLTNSYIPYGNGGKYYKASIIAKAVDSHTGEIIIDNETEQDINTEGDEFSFSKLLDKLPPMVKRVIGVCLALIVGLFFGSNFTPPQYLIDHNYGPDTQYSYLFVEQL